MGLTVSSAPATEPLTTAEAKLHLRIESAVTDDDALIDDLVAAARQLVERQYNRTLVTTTWVLRMDGFDDDRWCFDEGFDDYSIRLPRPPLVSVSSVAYVDTDGDSQTLAATAYQVDIRQEPGRIVPAYNTTWPVTRTVPNAVTVTYVAGYGAYTAVPEIVRRALMLMVGHWYRNRESVSERNMYEVPLAAEALLTAEWHGEYR